MKEITCAVLIPEVINGENNLLMAHSTGNTFWDVPKGCGEIGESAIETAIRELFEETGFVVSANELKDMGVFSYNSKKDMHVFVYIGSNKFKAEDGVCTSFFLCPYTHKEKMEVDDFKYVPFTEVRAHCTKSFIKVFDKVEKDLK